jgi:hypothetical protein
MSIYTESIFTTVQEFNDLSEFISAFYSQINGVPQIVIDAKLEDTLTESWTQLSTTSFKIVRTWADPDAFIAYSAIVHPLLQILSDNGFQLDNDSHIERNS